MMESSRSFALTPEKSSEAVIQFSDVRIGFADGEILRGVSFSARPKETLVLLGETGSGKTLVLKIATGLLRPDSGTVDVLGECVSRMTEHGLLALRRKVGFVFQEGALFDSLSVADNVAFRLREENLNDEEIEKRVREVLRFVEMEPAIEMYPGELSGGMRRRVSIARALVDHPPLVFYDSPTAGLDPVTSQTIITLILRGRDLQGVTSLLATHRVQDAFGLAHFRFDEATGRVVPMDGDGAQPAPRENATGAPPTNIVVLRDGRVYFEGTTDDLLHSSDQYLKTFLISAE